MRTIGTEEHFVTDEVVTAWSRLDSPRAMIRGPASLRGDGGAAAGGRRAPDRGDGRSGAGRAGDLAHLARPAQPPGREATRLQVETNDRIAELVNAHPDRFQGFATLATPAPAAAAQELERAVTKLGLNGALLFGRTGERNLDHPDNWPIFEAAASLRAPLYIHPQIPQPRVRAALYAGFDDAIDNAFANYGIGWHYESGVQFLRLALAGVFDRFPDLQVLLGHWGEVVLFYLERADGLAVQAKLPQPFSEYVRRNAYITAGGVYSQRYLRWAVEVVGVERILFATDYPYRPGPDGGVEHSFRPRGSTGPTRSGSPPATGMRSSPASGADLRPPLTNPTDEKPLHSFPLQARRAITGSCHRALGASALRPAPLPTAAAGTQVFCRRGVGHDVAAGQ